MQKMRDGYKKTEAGYIPNDWEYEKLNKIAVKITDGTHKTPTYTDKGVPFLRVTDIQSSEIKWNNVKYISEEEHLELIKRCKPEKGDILYSKNGTIGIAKIIDWDREFSIFVSLCLIKLNKEDSRINGKYLEQYLGSESCLEQIRLRAKQGTVTNLHLEEIRELVIPLPPVSEQRKIADILSTVDKQIEQTNALIEKTKELKKGLMQRLLTKGIGHTEFKDTEIGRIPKGWEVKQLGEIVQICYGKNQKEVETEDGIYKILGTGGVIGKTNEYLWDKPSVLIGRKGTIDKPMYIEEPFWTVDTLFYTKVNEGYVAKWLYYYLNKIDLKKYNEATGVPSLSIAVLNKILIKVPPIKEQRKITEILSAVDCNIDIYEIRKNKLENLKKSLMNQLLTGKIRVLT